MNMGSGAAPRPVAGRSAAAIARRPGLWPTAAAELLLMAPPRWWRRWPPLPVPDPDYLRFRMHTAYGDAPPSTPLALELVGYLEWCRRMRRLGR